MTIAMYVAPTTERPRGKSAGTQHEPADGAGQMWNVGVLQVWARHARRRHDAWPAKHLARSWHSVTCDFCSSRQHAVKSCLGDV